LGEAFYRLGLAYRRIGEESKAEQEFQVYEKVEKAETATIERQRRELRQSDYSKGPACSFLASLNTGTCYLSLGLTESTIPLPSRMVST